MALMHVLILALGGGLLVVPVVLHLLMQPKPKPLPFPALRFVQQMQRTNQRSLRLRHWLLLALRCLLLLAAAAALARPSASSASFGNWLSVGGGGLLSLLCGLLLVFALLGSRPANIPLALIVGAVLALALAWTGYAVVAALGKGSGNLLTDRQAPVAAAVVIDTSPRMQYRHENASLLEKAEVEAGWIIGQLPRDSRIAVIRNDGQPPFFSVDVGAARKRINTLETSYASISLPETIESAVRFLQDATQERKEIYVLSDMTGAGWLASGTELQQLLEAQPEISLYLIDVGVETPMNLSLDQLELSGSAIPEGGTVTVNAQLRAVGEGGSMVARLMLERPDPSRPVRRDGKTLLPDQHWMRATNVSVADDGATSLSLSLQDDFQPGIHHGWLELEASDALAVDNRLYFTVDVRPQWKVLVVHPENVDPGNLVDALGPSERDGGGFYDVRVIGQRSLPQEVLEDFNAIFLLDPGPISDPLWKLLENFVRGGGGLGIFLGHNAAVGSQPNGAFQTEAAAAVLPGRLERQWRSGAGEFGGPAVLISLDTLTHPALKPFRPYATLGIWQPFPVYRHWEMDNSGDPEVQVIARYTDGVASLVQRRIGDGHVICMTTPITEPAGRAGRHATSLERPVQQRQWRSLARLVAGDLRRPIPVLRNPRPFESGGRSNGHDAK